MDDKKRGRSDPVFTVVAKARLVKSVCAKEGERHVVKKVKGVYVAEQYLALFIPWHTTRHV